MIPIYLEMKAFGPYAGQEIVDFRRLGEHKLFLIYGPTGSGKTTILDAICYALYGSTSGNSRTGAHMRSEYASPEEVTSVSFRFAIGQKYYRVDRRPEQEIAKKRGTGLKKASAKAALYETDENGENEELLAAKNVTAAVEQLLGFKADQFRQVVLLPQGDFRRLLLANSGERQQIMQTLFHTQRYARFQELAKERHDALASQYEDVRRQREQCLIALEVTDENEIAAKETQWQVRQAETGKQQQAAEERRKAVQERFQAAQELASHWQLRDEKAKEAAALQQQEEAFQAKRQQIAILRKAEILAEPCRHLDDLEKEGKEARKAAEKAGRLAEKGQNDLKAAQQELADLVQREGEYKEAAAEKARLAALQDKAASYRDCCQAEVQCRKEAAAAEKAWREARQGKDAEKKALDQAQAAVAQLSETAVAAEQAKARWQSLQERLQQEEGAAALQAQIEGAAKAWEKSRTALAKATDKAQCDRRDYESVQAVFLQAQAAVLAAELEDGKPCPVCGAAAHPRPAVAPQYLPQRRDVERLKKQAEASESRRQQWQVTAKRDETRYQALQGQYHKLRQQYPQDGDLAVWQAKTAAAKKAMDDLQHAAADGEKMRRTAAAAQERLKQWEKKEETLRSQAEAARTAAVKAAEAKTRMEADLPEAYRNPQALEQRLSDLAAFLGRYEKDLQRCRDAVVRGERQAARQQQEAVNWQKQVLSLRDRFSAGVQALRQRVLADGFESVKACRQMQAQVPGIPVLEEEVRQYDTQVQQVKGQLAQEERVIGTKARPDLKAVQQALAEAEKASRALTEEKGRLAAQYGRWQEEKNKLATLDKSGQALTEEYKTVGAVYELIAGKQTGINFERYVLGALLDEVLAAANGRLQGMSRQRYSLQRSQNWDDKRVKQIGLDIEVYDNYTGYARPANTLSGGETFLASLSLALGLADVVQAYSGGIHLDTIFIDEGFGTLDGETLDYALKTLASLRSGGRLVGIISHVPELKERIDARLAVHKTDRGSTSSFEFA